MSGQKSFESISSGRGGAISWAVVDSQFELWGALGVWKSERWLKINPRLCTAHFPKAKRTVFRAATRLIHTGAKNQLAEDHLRESASRWRASESRSRVRRWNCGWRICSHVYVGKCLTAVLNKAIYVKFMNGAIKTSSRRRCNIQRGKCEVQVVPIWFINN